MPFSSRPPRAAGPGARWWPRAEAARHHQSRARRRADDCRPPEGRPRARPLGGARWPAGSGLEEICRRTRWAPPLTLRYNLAGQREH